jgi:hypothetical protein
MSTPTPRHGPGNQPADGPPAPFGAPKRQRGGARGLLIGAGAAVGVLTLAIAGLALLGQGEDNAPKKTTSGTASSPLKATDAQVAACEAAARASVSEDAEPDASTIPECEALNSDQRQAVVAKIAQDLFAQSTADTDSGDSSKVYKFGQTVTFEDGSTLVAGPPVKFTPDQYAAGGEKFKYHVKFKVTFTNKTSEVFDPTLTTGSVTSGEREGDSVYQDGLDAPDNKILPGKRITWWMGYGVDNPNDVQLTVSMGFLDYEDAIFTA